MSRIESYVGARQALDPRNPTTDRDRDASEFQGQKNSEGIVGIVGERPTADKPSTLIRLYGRDKRIRRSGFQPHTGETDMTGLGEQVMQDRSSYSASEELISDSHGLDLTASAVERFEGTAASYLSQPG